MNSDCVHIGIGVALMPATSAVPQTVQ